MNSILQWVGWSICFLPVLSIDLSLPANCVHSPDNRRCWRDGFNILTDYNDVSKIPTGKLVEYDLVLSEQVVAPDGYKRPGIVVNGQFPGPTIEASWGDTLRITVRNNLTNYNGTTIHWHGIRQWQTNWQDGVAGVTQCPIKPGGEQVYEFRATQYGTTWYHSHDSMQIADGLYGALIIHGPSSMNYDVDLGPWLLADWYHTNVTGLDWIPIYRDKDTLPPVTLLNGGGFLNCSKLGDQAGDIPDANCTEDHHYEVLFQQGTKYKIGVVGSTTLLAYYFWIDGHNMTVIQADMVPIEPFVTSKLMIASGQRYEIVVEANADFQHRTNFFINAVACNPRAQKRHEIGIIRYNEHDNSEPYLPPSSATYQGDGCHDVDLNNLVPVVKKPVGKNANTLTPQDYLLVGAEAYPNITEGANSLFSKWVFKDRPQSVDWKEPTLKRLSQTAGDNSLRPENVPIYLDFETDEWVHFLILGSWNFTKDTGLFPVMSYHPMHLHGHDLAILAQGSGPVDNLVPNLDNPPRRDTVILSDMSDSYLWVAFQVGNPGAWLFHCHIASHSLSGLSLQFIEQPRKIQGLMERGGVVGELSQRCDAWASWADAKDFSLGITSGI